jgi:PPP family 3-phenylpropionic acid transporter
VSRTGFALRFYFFVAFSGFGIVVPFLPVWLEAGGIRGAEMSVLVALRPAIGIAAPVLFGVLADALGLRGSLVRVACLGSAAVFAVMSATALTTGQLGFGTLLVLLSLFALFRSPMSTIAEVQALEAQSNYGSIRLWGSAGFMAVALIAGHYLDFTSRTALPLVLTCALLLAFAASLTLPKAKAAPTRPVWSDAHDLLGSTDFRWLLVAAFLWQVAHASYDLCVSLHFRTLGASGTYIGAAWALGTLAEVLLMAWSEKLLRRFGALRLLGLSFALAALRWVVLAEVESLPLLMLLQPLHAISFALAWVSSMTYVRLRAQPHILATAQGVYTAVLGAGATLGLLMWGPVYASIGGAGVFWIAALVAALSAGAVLFVRARSLSPAASPAE